MISILLKYNLLSFIPNDIKFFLRQQFLKNKILLSLISGRERIVGSYSVGSPQALSLAN